MITRLETIAKDLAEKLEMSNSEQQRKASIAACELALLATSLDIPVISKSFEQLRQNERISQEQTEELNGLVEQFDERYFDIQDEIDEIDENVDLCKTEENVDLQTERTRFFRQARAVSALSFAGGEDALVAAMESIYEASMVFDDNSNFFAAVKGVLL